MKYARRLVFILSVFLFLGTIGVSTSDAQSRVIVRRPVVIRPYWGYDRKKLNKDNAKYREDGVIDAKEAEKLAKDRRKYDDAVRKLNEYRNG